MGFFKELAILSKHEVTDQQEWYEIDGENGCEFYPVGCTKRLDALKAYRGTIHNVRTVEGYGARLAPTGGLQATAWVIFETAHEAREYLDKTFGPEELGT